MTSIIVLLLLLFCCYDQNDSYVLSPSIPSYSKSLSSLVLLSTSSSINDAIIDNQSGIIGLINKFKKPSHIGVPRSKMDLQFAVQLMRNSYNTVDQLDFVAMDEFQRTFFLFRQNEWEDYKSYHSNLMQGDLSDPVYFDFISYAQYAVIADKIRNGKQDFVEKVNATGDTQIVRRNPIYSDNKLLPIIHSTTVGDKILDYLIESYSKNPKLLPPPPNGQVITYEDFAKYSQLILDLFLINNYALSGDITPLPLVDSTDTETRIYKIVIRLPINLWGHQALIVRGDSPVNNFEIKVLQSLADRYNIVLELLSTSFTNKIDVNYIVKLYRK